MRRHIRSNAHVHDRDARAHVTGQHVDGRPAVQEVEHHLRRHFLREGAHALHHYTVVPGHGDDHLVFNGWDFHPGYPSQLNGQFFQPAQAAGRFCERGLARAGSRHGGFVQPLDSCDDVLQHCALRNKSR
jgi:hypothetical protein